jgi:hypothetical protein
MFLSHLSRVAAAAAVAPTTKLFSTELALGVNPVKLFKRLIPLSSLAV